MCNVLGLDNKKPCEMKQEWTQFRKKLEKKNMRSTKKKTMSLKEMVINI